MKFKIYFNFNLIKIIKMINTQEGERGNLHPSSVPEGTYVDVNIRDEPYSKLTFFNVFRALLTVLGLYKNFCSELIIFKKKRKFLKN